MKRQTAKDILVASFRELAEKKTIDKITIKEITGNCGYSPATFYRHFNDKYDLIAWDYTRKLKALVEKIGTGEGSWKQALEDTVAYYYEDREYLRNLFMHTKGMDSFVLNMTEINYSHLANCVREVAGFKKLEKETDMYVRLYVIGTVNIACEWILGRYDVSPKELAAIYESSLPEPLKKYLI